MTPRHEEEWHRKPSVVRFCLLRVLRDLRGRKRRRGSEPLRARRPRREERRLRRGGPSQSCETKPIPGGSRIAHVPRIPIRGLPYKQSQFAGRRQQGAGSARGRLVSNKANLPRDRVSGIRDQPTGPWPLECLEAGCTNKPNFRRREPAVQTKPIRGGVGGQRSAT